ncbi:50S ribosomal protein L31, partial [Streptomyces sp. NPDC060188]|uniref:50S ribosomal protein L31 n=1 Tax=Streptomyces sp. NPDC060188 TaxID=3347068 RepID=UPI0036694B9B
MKRDIHPEYVDTQVSCTCGASFTTRSTIDSGTIRAEVCSECHPFYTGKQKILDTGGRVPGPRKQRGAEDRDHGAG